MASFWSRNHQPLPNWILPAVRQGLARRWKAGAPQVYELLTNLPRRDCPIGLQNHGDVAWFRSIRVRALR